MRKTPAFALTGQPLSLAAMEGGKSKGNKNKKSDGCRMHSLSPIPCASQPTIRSMYQANEQVTPKNSQQEEGMTFVGGSARGGRGGAGGGEAKGRRGVAGGGMFDVGKGSCSKRPLPGTSNILWGESVTSDDLKLVSSLGQECSVV